MPLNLDPIAWSHLKRLRPQALLHSLVHLLVRPLHVARQALRVKQWRVLPVALQLLLQALGVTLLQSYPHRMRLILRPVLAHQLL